MKYRHLALLFIVVITLQLILGIAIYFSMQDWTTRASFGDMFGAVNTLFSGLAFAGVIYAIFLQGKELELQREELKLTRKELEKSANSQNEQAGMMFKAAKINAMSTKLNTDTQLFINKKQFPNSSEDGWPAFEKSYKEFQSLTSDLV